MKNERKNEGNIRRGRMCGRMRGRAREKCGGNEEKNDGKKREVQNKE